MKRPILIPNRYWLMDVMIVVLWIHAALFIIYKLVPGN